jgi:hypothetical protein
MNDTKAKAFGRITVVIQISLVTVNDNPVGPVRTCQSSVLMEAPTEVVVLDAGSTAGGAEMVCHRHGVDSRRGAGGMPCSATTSERVRPPFVIWNIDNTLPVSIAFEGITRTV